MLTRTILFLLAFMTGLSPFEAAYAAQPESTAVNASANMTTGLAGLTAHATVRTISHFRVHDSAGFNPAVLTPIWLAGSETPCVSCIFRSDRSRE